MVLKYHVSPSVIDEDFIIYIYEASNTTPGAHVDTQTLAKDPGGGHPAPATVIFNGLDKVVHVLKMYSVDSNALLHSFNAEPKIDIVTVFQPIRFKIGDGLPDTPLAGNNSATTPQLAGLNTNEFIIMRNGVGMLHPGIHYSFEPSTGEWQLLLDGDVFSGDPAEEFTILQQPKVVTTVVNDSVVGKWFGGFLDVAANTVYDATHLRKLVRFSGSPTYEYAIDPPIGYGYAFQHFGNTGEATIKFTNKPLKWIDGANKAELKLKSGREAMFSFDGAFWNVVYLCDSIFPDPSIVPAGTVLGSGNTYWGDVGPGDPSFTIVHNLNITGDYNVFLSVKSANPANYAKNNKMPTPTWWHDGNAAIKKDRFYCSMQEITGEVQDVTVTWLIIKA